jgi:heme-degrading monooxygenase HmoA
VSELQKILNSEAALAKSKTKFAEMQHLKKKLQQRRQDGRLLYDSWRSTKDWKQWRNQQLDKQNWQCASCGSQMSFGKITYLANGDFILEPQHPAVEHTLPKSLFPLRSFYTLPVPH